MSGDIQRVLLEQSLNNMRGVTQRVKEETTIDNTRGVTYRVYNVNGGGSAPVIDELNVTPSTSAQTITAPSGTVHFPSNFDPSNPNHTFDASTLAGYPTFGGDASYIRVAFDLPATE